MSTERASGKRPPSQTTIATILSAFFFCVAVVLVIIVHTTHNWCDHRILCIDDGFSSILTNPAAYKKLKEELMYKISEEKSFPVEGLADKFHATRIACLPAKDPSMITFIKSVVNIQSGGSDDKLEGKLKDAIDKSQIVVGYKVTVLDRDTGKTILGLDLGVPKKCTLKELLNSKVKKEKFSS